MLEFLEQGWRTGRFRRISQGFFTFERCFVRKPCDRIESILDVNMVRSAPGNLHAVCSQEVRAAVIGSVERPRPYSHWWLYNLPSCDDEYLSARTTPCASAINWTHIVFYREGLLVDSIPCVRSRLAVVALPYRHNLGKRFWTHIPSVSLESVVTLSAYCVEFLH